MKLTSLLAFTLLLAPQVKAFDPSGPPPKKTMEWTTNHIWNVTIPAINFERTSLTECLDFLKMSLGAPPQYQVEIDASALVEAKRKTPITMQGRNLKYIDVLVKIADAADANLLIEPGKIHLIPRKPAEPKPKETPAKK